jgi:hypothetical protein
VVPGRKVSTARDQGDDALNEVPDRRCCGRRGEAEAEQDADGGVPEFQAGIPLQHPDRDAEQQHE